MPRTPSRLAGALALLLLLAVLPVGSDAQPAPPDPRRLVAGGVDSRVVLPPEPPWTGGSRALALPADDEWATPCERRRMDVTPRYEETVAWLERLTVAAPELEMVSLGVSAEGRDVWMVVASREGARDPKALRDNGRPTLLVQGCIHAGESDGKDAGMMLLRDLTVKGTRSGLLDGANLLFIPILNVDGHERFTRFGRINQRGPEEMGWRTNARNRNLNRDYTKLDTPELRALVRALGAWIPDLYLDIHVTDGVDYQYDITWGYSGPHAHSPNTSAWLDAFYTPAVSADLTALGHVPGPLVFAVNSRRLEEGIEAWTAPPRFSHGYGDARHLPTVLVENHSLKSYPRRVLGTYVLLESTLRIMGEHGRELTRAADEDRRSRRREVPLGFRADEGPYPEIDFLGVRSKSIPSAVSGGVRVEWTGEPLLLRIPVITHTTPAATVARPRAYWISAVWSEVIERLEMHGIEVERTDEPVEMDVVMYRMEEAAIEGSPYEGRVRARGNPVPEPRRERFPAGSARISTDQPLGDLAILLLEPGAPDSFYRWGFFLEMLQRTEYFEGYVVEPLASLMMNEDPELAARFTEKVATDPDFASNPRARLDWFYARTPYHDDRWRLYPVAREE